MFLNFGTVAPQSSYKKDSYKWNVLVVSLKSHTPFLCLRKQVIDLTEEVRTEYQDILPICVLLYWVNNLLTLGSLAYTY